MRWASAEGVSQDVIAAVLLLHYYSVEEIGPKLSPAELDKVLVLVGRNPRLYPPGTMEALERRRKLAASVPLACRPPAAKGSRAASGSGTPPPRRHASGIGPHAQQSPPKREKGARFRYYYSAHPSLATPKLLQADHVGRSKPAILAIPRLCCVPGAILLRDGPLP